MPPRRVIELRVVLLGAVGLALAAIAGNGLSAGQRETLPVAATGPASTRAVAADSKPAVGNGSMLEPPATADLPPPPVDLRVYDIRDLIADVPGLTDSPDLLADDFSRGIASHAQATARASAQLMQGNICFPARRRPIEIREGQSDEMDPREQSIEDVTRLITDSVSPDSWRETGGMYGSIKELSGQLVITQTADNHRAVATLLTQIRESRSINARVHAHWVLVADRADLDKVLKPASALGSSRGSSATRPSLSTRPAALLATTVADLAALPSVLASFDAETVCVNGQRVMLAAVRNRSAGPAGAASATPAGAIAAPVPSPLLSGLSLDVQQVLSPDRATAVLTLDAQWKEAWVEPTAGGSATYRTSAVTRPTTAGSGGGKSSAAAEIKIPADRRDGRTQEIRTSARVPVGQMVLIGGTTLDPAVPAAGGKSPPRLYLFVEVTAD